MGVSQPKNAIYSREPPILEASPSFGAVEMRTETFSEVSVTHGQLPKAFGYDCTSWVFLKLGVY